MRRLPGCSSRHPMPSLCARMIYPLLTRRHHTPFLCLLLGGGGSRCLTGRGRLVHRVSRTYLRRGLFPFFLRRALTTPPFPHAPRLWRRVRRVQDRRIFVPIVLSFLLSLFLLWLHGRLPHLTG